ncbi:dipeptide ABC transporter ATP-binding protein [Phytoactinopolyspora halotolerans]|uniref:ABC transporter ATP-binding protein n=1 Tax=Phytoactinopolyspora halotolerans TaxID=1981512 RepID=A0A6L9S4D1_9ACTN|nr:ABC transporter ATP-binding protein [Phytoactinopolyspora halotolerans]NEE00335.1 ABC transporter ATP-binding protein [Phytoactinopolyspora halotolerans]
MTADVPALALHDLNVTFRLGRDSVHAARDVTFSVQPGEILALVGESGSGKSVSATAVLDLLPRTAERTGRIEVGGNDVTRLDRAGLRRLRGKDVAMVFQEPMTALNPVLTVGSQIVEALRLHTSLSKAAAKARAIELLDLVGLPDPAARFRSYPHQLSGGQRQRAVIAMAISCDPAVLIADEPTTALDVTVQAEILELLRDLRRRLSSAIVLITHDMGVVADIADRVVVMRRGEIVEQAPVDEIFARPRHPYTRELLAAVPHLGRRPETGRLLEQPPDTRQPADAGAAATTTDATTSITAPGTASAHALELRDVVVEYPGRIGRPAFRAVDGVTLNIPRGQIVGLVGESGSGKSTLGRCVVGLLRAASGQVVVDGEDISQASRRRLRRVRARIGMVFQDPASSLNPRYPIGDSIAEPFRLQAEPSRPSRAEIQRRVTALLESVELPAAWRHRFPHELSGGQRQRVGIARAIALNPALLVADEPTSALDVSVQARVLDLFLDLQARLGFSCLFISHDLAVVELLANRIAVMHRGTLVEQGSRDEVLYHPREEYTQRLLAAAPVPDPLEQRRRRAAAGS